MQSQPPSTQPDVPPLSAGQAILASLPFLGFGLASLLSKNNTLWESLGEMPFWLSQLLQPFLVFNWLVLIGLGIGLLKNSPRWTFAYLGWALLYGWWWTGMRSAGFDWEANLWLPLLAVFVGVALIRRSWRPWLALGTGLSQDWTLFSFGVYILYSFVFMLYDENHHPYLAWFILGATLFSCLGAWAYFRQPGPLRRVLALLAGLLGQIFLSSLNEATWDFAAYYGLPGQDQNSFLPGLKIFALMAVILLGNGLIARWRHLRRQRV
ncbi:MAG: hypothetical protein MUE67_07790 [Anaerolineales bacterium]|jgi:hypothetical protein|nr:hypothetical protein [Anaerolineales bacterium]